ncbi:hypothetical protein G6F56_000323 [Rhizopus delemar]|nr:hypothetical protein G6F56_000323 [Rhizopus delemar]
MTTLEKEKLSQFIETLNSVQKESVLSDATTLQILAGPGSGKTRVLTCRVAHLVIEKGVSPKDIIVVTFTNKAANEMKKRLFQLIGEMKTSSLLIGTFHSICCRLLRRHGQAVGLKSDFTIADNTVRNDEEISNSISDFVQNKMKTGAILGIISSAKSKRKDYVQLQKESDKDYLKEVGIIYREYEIRLKKLNLVDFDNLLMKCCDLLEKKTDVLPNIKCILVDEYQDTNIIQYDLIKLMMAQINIKTVTIVGDPDQSIFGWRSAEPKNFGKMAEEFKETEAINLEQNYRSTASILGSALHVIKQDPDRLDKSLYTDNPGGIPISIITVYDQTKQADFVASEIRKVINYSKGLIQYKDIAVLMRMNFISNDIEMAFRNHKIPHVVVGGDRFFGRMEVKDIISYLEFIYNPSNTLAFQRIINVPKRGIGDATLKKLTELNNLQGTDLLATLITVIRGESQAKISPMTISNLKIFVKTCVQVREMIRDKDSVADMLAYIVKEIEYEDYLKSNYFQDHVARLENVGQLINIATEKPVLTEEVDDFLDNDDIQLIEGEEPDDIEEVDMTLIIKEEEEEHIEPVEVLEDEGVMSTDPVAEFLEFCTLCSNQKEQEEAEGGKVTIGTIHASKGLEWPCVFIVSCSEGIIPHSRANDLNEEGRLLYVGMTRSKFLLYCISPKMRQQFGDYISSEKSRYLDDMDTNLFVNKAPDWDNDVRDMLATTLGKPKPSPDDTLVTKKDGRNKKSFHEYSSSQPVYNDVRFGIHGSKVDLASMGGFTSAMTMHEPYYSSSQPTKRSKTMYSMSQFRDSKEKNTENKKNAKKRNYFKDYL